MTHYYYKKRSLSSLCVLFVLLTPAFGFSQTGETSESLLAQRRELIDSDQSTKEIDLQLYQLNVIPSAVVHLLNENTFVFSTYQQANAQREEKVNARLQGVYSYLSLIDFNDDFSSVTIVCNQPVTAEMINELVTHFGFEGHEIH